MTYEQQLEQKIADQEKIIESLLNDIKTIVTKCHITGALAVTVVDENTQTQEYIPECIYSKNAYRHNNRLIKKEVIPLDNLSIETRDLIRELKLNEKYLNTECNWTVPNNINYSTICYSSKSYNTYKDKYNTYTKTRRK